MENNSHDDIKALTSEAINGNADAQFRLACHYQKQGDDKKAEYWLEKAIENGYVVPEHETNFISAAEQCYNLVSDLKETIIEHTYLLEEYYSVGVFGQMAMTFKLAPIATKRQNLWREWKDRYKTLTNSWNILMEIDKEVAYIYSAHMDSISYLHKRFKKCQGGLFAGYLKDSWRTARKVALGIAIPTTALLLGGISMLNDAGNQIGASSTVTRIIERNSYGDKINEYDE